MRFGSCVVLAFALLPLGSGVVARGQMHHVDAAERITRAVGVYEWTGELGKPKASRFVPVSLFIDGHFEDAGLYLARPVPFALQDGDLYTVEHAGEPRGVLDLQNAERVVTGTALADDNPSGTWYGFGSFREEAPSKAPPALHRSAHLPVIQGSSSTGKAADTSKDQSADSDDGRPHMSRRGTATGDAGADSGTTSDHTGEDTDRPTLARRNPAQDSSRRRTAAGGKGNTASVTAVGPQPGDDPDRPRLGHSLAADDGPQPLTGMPADLHQAVAVSDATHSESHPFARPWDDPAERQSTLAILAGLARPRVEAYLSKNGLVPSAAVEPASAPGAAPGNQEGIAANTESGAGAPPRLVRGKPAEYGGSSSAATSPAAAAPTPPTPVTKKALPAASRRGTKGSAPHAVASPLLLRNEQVEGFVLSYGGLPTFVYSASAAAAPARATPDAPPAALHSTVYVTLVAQRLPSGELQVALAGVTDSLHLDRAPRMQLIDAVDPDDSHRASLLFQLRGASSRQFALFRLTSAHAENTFTTASIE